MSELKSYKVTEKAGPRINGKPVKAGETVEMTEKQARIYLRSGQITAASQKTASKTTKTSETASSDGDA